MLDTAKRPDGDASRWGACAGGNGRSGFLPAWQTMRCRSRARFLAESLYVDLIAFRNCGTRHHHSQPTHKTRLFLAPAQANAGEKPHIWGGFKQE